MGPIYQTGVTLVTCPVCSAKPLQGCTGTDAHYSRFEEWRKLSAETQYRLAALYEAEHDRKVTRLDLKPFLRVAA
jgi:hypothetical protein